MRVTSKGQVTIPKNIREVLGIIPQSDIEFQEDNGRFYIMKKSAQKSTKNYERLRGISTARMSTEEILNLTRK